MKIAIIGAGNVGHALATSFSAPVTTSSSPRAIRRMPAASPPPPARGSPPRTSTPRPRPTSSSWRCHSRAPARSPPRSATPSPGKLVVDVTQPDVVRRRRARHRHHLAPTPRSSPPSCLTLTSSRRSTRCSPSNQVDPIADGVQLDGFVAGDDRGRQGRRPRRSSPRSASTRSTSARSAGPVSSRASPSSTSPSTSTRGGSWQSGWKLVGAPASVSGGRVTIGGRQRIGRGADWPA